MQNKIKEIIDDAYHGKLLNQREIKELLDLDTGSEEFYYLLFKARQMSAEACSGKAEIHGQVGVNSGPCGCNCAFCSFAAENKIFTEQQVEPLERVLEQSLDLEQAGANAIYLMATAQLNFQGFLEMGRQVRRELRTSVPLIANMADFNDEQAVALRQAGFAGVYHAVRIGEGVVNRIKLEDRLQTIEAARRAGLAIGTCVEPIGPEHSVEEIIEKIIIAREAKPGFSGAMRRVTLPGTSLSRYGMVGEARMALIVGVVRLVTPREVPGNCTHEPNAIGAVAGANLFWAEAGSNPRDVVNYTETNRGFDVGRCKKILVDAGWQVLEGPSKFC
ncbi:biotin synthase [Sporotomaculum syntrophicum]|uniref:Biotin synthase n=1 Tax=Sporotomaculum syntrophicum TaxID=182264 RepID=A0A9D3AX36_9FIRM|nr:radical SAM protein [Sporotomaculum syntrophicum]KAF1083966.1 biotin synthase [Sporotomaculum syntrophicum]